MAQILVVAMSAKEPAAATVNLLAGRGHDVIFAAGFEAAVLALADHSPDLLISEVRLAQFNGLHLVIRSYTDHPTMRAILLDRTYDSVIEFDAQRHGATYLVEPVGPADLLVYVSRKLARISPQRRWPRKQPAGGLVARIAQRPARVVDMSYGGLRLELPQANKVPSRFHVAFPGFEVVVRARPVWTRRTPSGWISCGAELSEANPRTLAMWRQLVDSVQHAA